MLLGDLVYLSAGWHLIWLAIRKLYSRSSRKYAMSIFQILHSVIYIEEAIYLFTRKYQGVSIPAGYYMFMMRVSMSYFIYDNFGKPFPTIYTLHHLLSVIALLLLYVEDMRDVFAYGMLMLELSNIPLFLGYGMRHKNIINKNAIRRCDRITLYIYAFFRGIAYLGIFLSEHLYKKPEYIAIGVIWYLPGLIWTKKMYSSLKKTHLI